MDRRQTQHDGISSSSRWAKNEQMNIIVRVTVKSSPWKRYIWPMTAQSLADVSANRAIVMGLYYPMLQTQRIGVVGGDLCMWPWPGKVTQGKQQTHLSRVLTCVHVTRVTVVTYIYSYWPRILPEIMSIFAIVVIKYTTNILSQCYIWNVMQNICIS